VSSAAAEQPSLPTDPEDLKLITLARAALGRTAAPQGACVRDAEGRAYAGATVHLEHLRLSAVAVAVAMAVSSGADGLDAVAVVGGEEPSAADLEIVSDLAIAGAAIWWADTGGTARLIAPPW
jgi:hypothetical protein